MKSNKTRLATFLTLILVFFGILIILRLSFFNTDTKNKIAVSSRAECSIPEEGKALCFCQKGVVRIYASSTARKNNCMGSGPEKYCNGGTCAYGASSWGYCDDNGSNYEGDCSSDPSSGGGSGPTNTPKPSSQCPEPSFTCASATTVGQFSNDTQIFSKDNQGIYYEGSNCQKNKKINTNGYIQDFNNACSALENQSCMSDTCKHLESLYGNASGTGAQPLNKTVYYKKDPQSSNPVFFDTCGATISKTREEICYPIPSTTPTNTPTPTPSCERITCAAAMNDGGSYYEDDSRPIYHYTNVPNVYYSDRTCNNVFNGDGWKDNCKLDVGFEVRENGAPGVNLSDLYCNKNGTGIVYKPGTNSISVATDKCLNTYNFKRSCLKLVASDLGWFTGFTGNNYIYCCSADSYCSE